MDGTNDLLFAIYAKQLGLGLEEQLKKFVRQHPDTKLIIIDTLQKVREVGGDKYSYANDYEVVGKLKRLAMIAVSVSCWYTTPESNRQTISLI